MAKKTFKPIHPLRMAEAITEINTRAGAVIITAHTARDLAPGANEAQLRTLINSICDSADALQACLWNEDEG